MRRVALIVLSGLILAGCGGEKTVSPTGPVEGTLQKAAKGNPAAGKKVFADNGCGSCHTFAPAGATGKIGPDLSTVLKGKSADFIKTSITDPNAYIAPGFKSGVMPTLPLTPAQVADLVAFLTKSP